MNRDHFSLPRRRALRHFVALALPAILFACREPEKPTSPSGEQPTPSRTTREIPVGRFATLQTVINDGVAATSGAVRGVHLIRDGQELSPELRIELREGDRIVTDAATEAVIESEKGLRISLGANSDITLRSSSVFLKLGSLLVSIKRVFEVDTELVVAGVKGTDLAVSAGSEAIMALVVDGTVEIQSKADNWTPRSYARGEGCVVRGAAAPETLTRNAIASFHRRDYDTAVALYDRALRADPGNAYVLNLKAYSLFKGKRLSNAIGTQRESLRVDPEYAWGYFDLARFQCAAGDFAGARKSIELAREKGGAWLSEKMRGDGEFRRLCARALEYR